MKKLLLIPILFTLLLAQDWQDRRNKVRETFQLTSQMKANCLDKQDNVLWNNQLAKLQSIYFDSPEVVIEVIDVLPKIEVLLDSYLARAYSGTKEEIFRVKLMAMKSSDTNGKLVILDELILNTASLFYKSTSGGRISRTDTIAKLEEIRNMLGE